MGDPLSRDELALILTIIDMAAQRGLFKGEELSTVGHIFGRLKAIAEQPQEPAGE